MVIVDRQSCLKIIMLLSASKVNCQLNDLFHRLCKTIQIDKGISFTLNVCNRMNRLPSKAERLISLCDEF